MFAVDERESIIISRERVRRCAILHRCIGSRRNKRVVTLGVRVIARVLSSGSSRSSTFAGIACRFLRMLNCEMPRNPRCCFNEMHARNEQSGEKLLANSSAPNNCSHSIDCPLRRDVNSRAAEDISGYFNYRSNNAKRIYSGVNSTKAKLSVQKQIILLYRIIPACYEPRIFKRAIAIKNGLFNGQLCVRFSEARECAR